MPVLETEASPHLLRCHSLKSLNETSNSARTPRQSCIMKMKHQPSRFAYVTCTCSSKEKSFTDLPEINSRLSSEGSNFCASILWIAVPLQSTGAVLALLRTDEPGRYSDRLLLTIETGAKIEDFAWDPFNPNCLAVAGIDGKVRFWRVSDFAHGWESAIPYQTIRGRIKHSISPIPSDRYLIIAVGFGRVSCLRFNPVATDVFAAVSDGIRLGIWSREGGHRRIVCTGHTEQILSIAWDTVGSQIVTLSKDCHMRIYEPRQSAEPFLERRILESPKSGRVLFVCKDEALLVSSFSKISDRLVGLYSARTFDLLAKINLMVSPQLLIPHYDYDTSVVFLTSRGDETIHMYEIVNSEPYFLRLLPFSSRSNRFEKDLFPDSLVTWEPRLTAAEWFDGVSVPLLFLSLRPKDHDRGNASAPLHVTEENDLRLIRRQWSVSAIFFHP
ncbi:WD domain, G-beta repeat protein [Trichuris suis]|nr:WD domain, G-beta repeat protein [Trichuris suis]